MSSEWLGVNSSMSLPLLGRQLRAVLGNNEASALVQLLTSVDDFVLTTAETEGSKKSLNDLNDELHTIHDDCADHSPAHLEIFLAVLFHLCPISSPISIISSWFDLVVRPALREPKLPTVAVNHAKELVILALQESDNVATEEAPRNKKAIPSELRRRLLDLYLLDAYNEGSGGDILEWAELDKEKKDIRACWKLNLEDILLRYGAEHPQDLMTEVYMHFSTPSTRLQLLMFLTLYTSDPSFHSSATILAPHPLTSSLLSCLLLDNSSTVCQVALTLLVKILPVFAVRASDNLKNMLPSLLAILARMMCWKARPPSSDEDDDDENTLNEDLGEVEGHVSDAALQLRDDQEWERLDQTFESTLSTPPCPQAYFTMLYYLFPCNVLLFIRQPVRHLRDNGLKCPYTIEWDDVLDDNKIRSKSESLLRMHTCHPSIIWRDGVAELAEPNFWSKFDVSQIVSEASLLNLRNATFRLRAVAEPISAREVATPSHRSEPSDEGVSDDFHITRYPQNTVVSLEEMIKTSVALRYNADVEIVAPTSQWSSRLFASAKSGDEEESMLENETNSRIPEALSALQREVLLLRSELNFEQWLSRENAKHIGRLYHDRTLSKNAEAERQGLFNKLRKYRAQVVRLEAELKEHKEQASSAKSKYADWNMELQRKLRELRDEKKSWITEAATLRANEKEAKALSEAQKTLLSDATQEVFTLKTQITENQHKVDRLRDYERQIDQHLSMQRLWEDDFRKFNDRGDHIEIMKKGWKQLELRLDSYEKAQSQLEETIRLQRQETQTLQVKLAQSTQPISQPCLAERQIQEFQGEKARLVAANTRLKTEKSELKEEVEELRAMVEVLKGQVSGRKGLVSEPRASPVLFI